MAAVLGGAALVSTVQSACGGFYGSLAERSLSSRMRRSLFEFSERPPASFVLELVDGRGGRQLGREGRPADEPLAVTRVGGLEDVGGGSRLPRRS
jgi:hypothetical protein